MEKLIVQSYMNYYAMRHHLKVFFGDQEKRIEENDKINLNSYFYDSAVACEKWFQTWGKLAGMVFMNRLVDETDDV